MTEIKDIKITIPGAGRVQFIDDLEIFEWELVTEVHGQVRELGKLTHFRFEDPNVVTADFISAGMYGDQLIRDYNERNASFTAHLSPEREVEGMKEGNVQFCVTGWLMMPEPPTTACDDCGKKFPAMDAQHHGGSQEQWFLGFRSEQWPDRVLCPECFERGKEFYRYKEKEDAGEPTQS